MVTNPVDVLARVFATTVGQAARVYGIASSTDSVRYRLALATTGPRPQPYAAG